MKALLTLFFLSSLSLSATLLSKSDPPPHLFTGAVYLYSDYRSRGISQTLLKPCIQGEAKYTHDSGFYFKAWGCHVDGTDHFLNNACSEWNFFTGLRRPLFHSEFTCDIGLLYYWYPGARADVPAKTSYDTLEYYVAFEYKHLELKLSLTTTDFFGTNSSNPPMNWNTMTFSSLNGHSYGSPYIELNYEYAFNKFWKLETHIGYQGVIHYPELSYLDWMVTVSRSYDWFNIEFVYIQTTARKAFYDVADHAFHEQRYNLGSPTLVIGIVRSF